MPDTGPINQSTIETISKEVSKVAFFLPFESLFSVCVMFFHYSKRFSSFFQNVFSEGLSVLRACSNVNSEEKKFDNGTEAAEPAYPDDPRRQDSGHFVTQETDEIIPSQPQTGVCVNTLFMLMSHFFYS